MDGNRINVGIGFATGRRHFRRILRSNVCNWRETGLDESERVSLNVFVAYDLEYCGTEKSDFTSIGDDVARHIDHAFFVGTSDIRRMKSDLVSKGVLDRREADAAFGSGYAAQRNALLYEAMCHGMDCMVFLDDDEYPLSVVLADKTMVWWGQPVLREHIENLLHADVTCGFRCGCVSPIPRVEYAESLDEGAFKQFIGAISNDIVNWDSVQQAFAQKGITYADPDVFASKNAVEEPETNGLKFISGSNLGINLTDPSRVFPFFNPPGARGEDTFLATCLRDRTVMRVPCYTFHDAFSAYSDILVGSLPMRPVDIDTDSPQNVNRFLRACIGWVRYKPLLARITDEDGYEQGIEETADALRSTLPAVSAYFQNDGFMRVLPEFERYDRLVPRHMRAFQQTKAAWAKIMRWLEQQK